MGLINECSNIIYMLLWYPLHTKSHTPQPHNRPRPPPATPGSSHRPRPGSNQSKMGSHQNPHSSSSPPPPLSGTLLSLVLGPRGWGTVCQSHRESIIGIRVVPGISSPRTVPTQVKCKTLHQKRQGVVAWDAYCICDSKRTPKSQLWNSSHPRPVTEAPNMAVMAIRAYRPCGRPQVCNPNVYSSSPLILCIGGTTIMTGNNQAWRVVDAPCLRLTTN